MGREDAIDGLKKEFQKFNLENGNVRGVIDFKSVESNLRILICEHQKPIFDLEEFVSLLPGYLLSLTSDDSNLRQSVARFLSVFKELIILLGFSRNEWDSVIKIELLQLCGKRLITIVEEYSDDWVEPWLFLVFVTLNIGLKYVELNILLSVIEKTFKLSANGNIKLFEMALQTWDKFVTILADSKSYNDFIGTTKLLKLLILPFIEMKHAYLEPFKHKTWFHIVDKVGLHSASTAKEIVGPFLNYLIENKQMFHTNQDSIGNYLKVLSQNDWVASNHTFELLNCIEDAVECGVNSDDLLSGWTSLCSRVSSSNFNHDYLKKLLYFLKTVVERTERKDITIELCLVAFKHRMFDFKSIYIEDIKSACEEIFPVVISSAVFREKIFYKILSDMMEMIENVIQENEIDEKECMSPILTMWDMMVFVYCCYMDTALDSRFVPSQIDISIIKDLIIIPLTQSSFNTLEEDNHICNSLRLLLQQLAKKMKTDVFSSEFLLKMDAEIKSARVPLENSLRLVSLASEVDSDINLTSLLSIISKSIASSGRPKFILEFLRILDSSTEKTGLKINFKAPLNFLRKFSSSYEPPYDQQIRQLAHALLKRISDAGDSKPPVTCNDGEEKKPAMRSPLTVHSNFLSRLSKAEEKKNNKTILAASIFPRCDSEITEINKENKQSISSKDSPKLKSPKSDEIGLTAASERFAKSTAFIIDNCPPAPKVPSDSDNFQPKVSHFKVSTDFHKTVTPTKPNPINRVVAGLSPIDSASKLKESSHGSSPRIDKSNTETKRSPKSPGSKNKFCFLTDSAFDNEEFVFVLPKNKPSPLTKHQKEVLMKRREEIPALYQDLSQDTQNTCDLSSTDTSSVENSVFNFTGGLPTKKTYSRTGDISQKKDITCALEENAVFGNIPENGSKTSGTKLEVHTVDESKVKNNLFPPKRLNFEGICEIKQNTNTDGDSNSKSSDTPQTPRCFARKSTSKYRKSLPSGTEVPINLVKRKDVSTPDGNVDDNGSLKKLAVDSEPASHDFERVSKMPKKRGRKPKRKSEEITDSITCASPSANLNGVEKDKSVSPVMTRRRRKSINSKTNKEKKRLEEADSRGRSTAESNSPSGIEPDRPVKGLCASSDRLSEDTVEILSDSEEKESVRSKDQLKKPEKVIEEPNSSSTNDHQISKSAGSSTEQQNQLGPKDTSTFLTESNISEVVTPPSAHTPNRRKRCKKSIQYNEFSPKMLRKGKNSTKKSPDDHGKQKNKGEKSFNLDEINSSSKVTERTNEFGGSSALTLDKERSEILKCDSSSINPVSDLLVAVNHSLQKSPTKNGLIAEDLSKSSLENVSKSSATTPDRVNKDSLISKTKTSPTRAMLIMKLVNSNNKVTDFRVKSPKNSSKIYENENFSSPPKSTKFCSVSDRCVVLNNALIAEEFSKADDSPRKNKLSIMESAKKNIYEDDTVAENLTPTCKRKSPTTDKINNLPEIPPQYGAASASKIKKSSLDGWLIKKDKGCTDGVSLLSNDAENSDQTDKKIESTDSVQDNYVDELKYPIDLSCHLNRCDDDISDRATEITDDVNKAESGTLSTHVSPENQKEPDSLESITVDSPSTPQRWPKRGRKQKKPSDFIYMNTMKRSRNNENKVTPTRKPKPQKQMDISPSKPYSFTNWPKGDCQAWVACEPAPPGISPSSAILKRRTSYPSPPKNQTSPASLKKRVSFLDPPVTKGLLYSKSEAGGEVQHSITESVKPVSSRRRKLLVGDSSFSKERNEFLVEPAATSDSFTEKYEKVSDTKTADDELGSVKMESESPCNSGNGVISNTNDIHNSENLCINDRDSVSKTATTICSVPERDALCEIEVESRKAVSETVDDSAVTADAVTTSSFASVGEIFEGPMIIANEVNVVTENNVNDGKTSADLEEKISDRLGDNNEQSLLSINEVDDRTVTRDYNETDVNTRLSPALESEDCNDMEVGNDRLCEEQVDIIAQVVGKISEGSACIVEPVETCNMTVDLSDESAVSIIDSDIFMNSGILLGDKVDTTHGDSQAKHDTDPTKEDICETDYCNEIRSNESATATENVIHKESLKGTSEAVDVVDAPVETSDKLKEMRSKEIEIDSACSGSNSDCSTCRQTIEEIRDKIASINPHHISFNMINRVLTGFSHILEKRND